MFLNFLDGVSEERAFRSLRLLELLTSEKVNLLLQPTQQLHLVRQAVLFQPIKLHSFLKTLLKVLLAQDLSSFSVIIL